MLNSSWWSLHTSLPLFIQICPHHTGLMLCLSSFWKCFWTVPTFISVSLLPYSVLTLFPSLFSRWIQYFECWLEGKQLRSSCSQCYGRHHGVSIFSPKYRQYRQVNMTMQLCGLLFTLTLSESKERTLVTGHPLYVLSLLYIILFA